MAVLALAVTLATCHEPDEVRVVEARALFSTDAVDFGDVPVGEWREADVALENVGYVPFNALEALLVGNDPSFRVELDGGAGRVMPGERRIVRLRFRPLQEGPLTDAATVLTDAEHKPQGALRLRGSGIPLSVRVWPPALDFQTLEVDSDRTMDLWVENPADLPLTLTIAGGSAGQFGAGTATIPPLARLAVDARYFPRDAGASAAQLLLSPCPTCTPTRVELSGQAVKSAFVFDPAPVPFDDIPVHQSTRSVTRMTNVTWRPVRVSGLSTSDRSFAALTDLTARTVGPGEGVEVELQFAARYAGPSLGTLEVSYESDRPRSSSVLMDARGGRPVLALNPVSIDFGELPVGAKVERVVRLSNAGTRGDLHFQGVRGAAGDLEHFGAAPPGRGGHHYPWSPGSAWPDLEAPDLPIAPGPDHLDVRVSFAPLAPGDFRATLVFLSDDLFDPERPVTVTGRARAAGPCAFRLLPQPSLDFGNVPVGHLGVLGFRFENAGATECAVKDIHLSNDAGGAFYMPGGPIAGGVIYRDDSFAAQIAFRASAEGLYQGDLQLTVNDPARPLVRLPLTGLAMDTCLIAVPRIVDFGAIRYDCPTTPRRTLLSNQCTGPTSVSAVWIGPGTSDDFSLEDAPAMPLTLAPGQGFEVTIAYARSLLGQNFSPLFVQAQDEPAPLLVSLLGETNREGLRTDRFVQGRDGELDVLFVVSNTTTMGPYQERLRAAIPAWMSRVSAAGVDLRAAVTTTGLVPRDEGCRGGARGGEGGRFFPIDGSTPRVVAGTAAPAVVALEQNLDVGQCHNLVQGLAALRQALSPPLVNHADDPRTPQPGDGNLGFLRPTARLAVVFLSDEDDHSGFHPSSYVELLRMIKGPNMSHRATAYAIVPTDPNCRTAGPPGPRFAQVAQDTGGQVLNVCGPDYAPLLEAVTTRAAGAQRDFRLTAVPASLAEMSVWVDGALQDSARWRFDAATNSVVFEPLAIPQPGQLVEVRYRQVCRVNP